MLASFALLVAYFQFMVASLALMVASLALMVASLALMIASVALIRKFTRRSAFRMAAQELEELQIAKRESAEKYT